MSQQVIRTRYLYAQYYRDFKDPNWKQFKFIGLSLMDCEPTQLTICDGDEYVYLGSVQVAEDDFQKFKDDDIIKKINKVFCELNDIEMNDPSKGI